MLRKLRCGLFAIQALLSVNVMAAHHEFAPAGVSIEYEFPPNNPQEISNSFFWTITSTCTVHTKDQSDDLYVEILKKSGKINGQSLSQGDTITLTLHDKDKFVITAESGAKVRLINQGQSTIVANCSA